MKGKQISYSAKELAWVKANAHLSRREAHKKFVKRFNRPELSVDNIKSLCTRKGWKTGRDGRFETGSTPPNKGKKMPYNANSARTQFKKGSMNGTAKEKYKPIGTERITKDGYVERKVHDGMPLQSRWRTLHSINWERVNGALPKDHCLKCIDGNKANTDPTNWQAIPRAMLPRLAGRKDRGAVGYDQAAPELKPIIMAVAKLAHAAKEKADPDD